MGPGVGMIREVGRAGHGGGSRFHSRELWEAWSCLEKAVI